MCLVKVRQEEDVVVPYRRAPSPVRRRSVRRVSRVSQSEVFRESPRPSQSFVAVPAPKPLPIPAPQPVPVFVEPVLPPAPAPPPPRSHVSAHYVEVSPRSSVSSYSPSRASEYVTHEREYRRERNYSPESSPRYEHFRYVDAAPEPDRHERHYRRERSRSRARSTSRGRDYGYDPEPRGSYRETRETIRISDRDGRRMREYRQ